MSTGTNGGRYSEAGSEQVSRAGKTEKVRQRLGGMKVKMKVKMKMKMGRELGWCPKEGLIVWRQSVGVGVGVSRFLLSFFYFRGRTNEGFVCSWSSWSK